MKVAATRIAAAGLMANKMTEAMTGLVARLIPHTTLAKPSHSKYGIEALVKQSGFPRLWQGNLKCVAGCIREEDTRGTHNKQQQNKYHLGRNTSNFHC
jgi:hypothetical protein